MLIQYRGQMIEANNETIKMFKKFEEKIIRMELGDKNCEEIVASRKAINMLLDKNELDFEKDGRMLKEVILEEEKRRKEVFYQFLEELKFEKDLDYIRQKRKTLIELKDKYKTLLEKPNLLDYDNMQDLIVTILSSTALSYKPTETHNNIYQDLIKKINYPYSTRVYSKLDDEKKREIIINWGTQVNNIFVLCGYEPIFEESGVTLTVEVMKRYLPFWKKVKLQFQNRFMLEKTREE